MTEAGDDVSCVFCRIVDHTIRAQIAAESTNALGFYDLSPVAPTHILVVPKRHIEDAAALSIDDGGLLAEMFDLANSIASDQGIAKSGYRLVMNVGDHAGNSVAHLHLHLLGGRSLEWPPG